MKFRKEGTKPPKEQTLTSDELGKRLTQEALRIDREATKVTRPLIDEFVQGGRTAEGRKKFADIAEKYKKEAKKTPLKHTVAGRIAEIIENYLQNA